MSIHTMFRYVKMVGYTRSVQSPIRLNRVSQRLAVVAPNVGPQCIVRMRHNIKINKQ